MRKVRRRIAAATILLVAALAIGWFAAIRLPKILVARHMISVTQSLKSWGQEYSQIKNDTDAFRAIEVWDYMAHYYVPSEGYRGPAEVEGVLERQRHESVRVIVAALEKHSGQSYGTNQSNWQQWAEQKGYRPVH